jgi:hypothetical protein
MIFQIGMNPKLAEKVFRSGLSGVTKTTTITAASAGLGAGMPVILATASASANGYYVQKPVTSTTATPENNLFIGLFDHSLGSVYSYAAGEDPVVVQCYGANTVAILGGVTATQAAGCAVIPDLGYVTPCGSPVTAAAATGTAVHAFPFGLGALACLIGTVDTVAATTDTSTVAVFLRCM